MAPNSVEAFDTTIQKTYEWLHEIGEELGMENRRHAYLALRGTLHAVRDFLPIDESAQFSAQLPMLVRGIYFEGWNPSANAMTDRSRERFLHRVEASLERALWSEGICPEAEQVAPAVLRVIANHVSPGEFNQVRLVMPQRIREFWPQPPMTIPPDAPR